MSHVWQRERGINVILRGLVSGMVSYRYTLDGRLLNEYPMEQQAQIIADPFALKEEGYDVWQDFRDSQNVTFNGVINEALIRKSSMEKHCEDFPGESETTFFCTLFLSVVGLFTLAKCPGTGDRVRPDEETRVSRVGDTVCFSVPDAQEYQPANTTVNRRGGGQKTGKLFLPRYWRWQPINCVSPFVLCFFG